MTTERKRLVAVDCDDVLVATSQHTVDDYNEDALKSTIGEVNLFGDYPWNRRDSLPERMVYCKDWSRVMEEIEVYAAG